MVKSLNLSVTETQGAFQRGPDKRLSQSLQGVKHQIPTVGAVDGTGPNSHEVATPATPILDSRLNEPEEIFIGGRCLKDDRCTRRVRIIDDEIHLIVVKRLVVISWDGWQ